MQNSEELAQEALKFLDLAQKFEEQKKVKEALENYEKAVEFLKSSGYLIHRIQDIYERIQELKGYLRQDKLYQYSQAKAQIEQVQDQAFTLLDGAKKLESDGFLEDAIRQYNSAINLLAQAGWSDLQLDSLRAKTKKIIDNIQRKKAEEGQEIVEDLKMEIPVQVDQKPQIADMFGKKTGIDKAKSIETYKSKRKREEEIQSEAFTLIDNAKIFEKEGKIEKAIINYERAIELLNLIGWGAQTLNIRVIIDKLKIDQQNIQNFQTQELEISDSVKLKMESKAPIFDSEAESREQKLIDFEEKKKKEEEIQARAFNLVDIGKRFDRESNYEKAVEKFNQAIDLLKSIEWDAYIQPIINLINDIREKQKREIKTDQLREKRERELRGLQDSITLKQKEELAKSAQDIEQKKRELEQKREEKSRKENEFYSILEKADGILQEQKDFDNAINHYFKAIDILNDLGAGWEHYISTIKSTISNIKRIKESQLKKQEEEQERLKRRQDQEVEFQTKITEEINKEREKLKQKEIALRDYELEKKYREERKDIAFNYLDDAQDYIRKGDYDNALKSYQNAGKIFAEIQWLDELPLIEKGINEIEQIKRKHTEEKQKEIQKAIERHKDEEEFQRKIAKQLQLEREKLRKTEIELKEHAEKLEKQEERRNAGFKLIEEAQIHVKEENFDEAIEILQYAINFFADTQWQNEISLIQNYITEIESRKRDLGLKNQIKLQNTLEREKQEKEFQDQIRKMMIIQRQRLKEKEIKIRERKEEEAYHEKRKKNTFYLLDKAQILISQNKLEQAIDVYYDVINIFAEINWNDEIPIIKKSIQNLQTTKRDNEILQQKIVQKSIEEEASNKAFVERIKTQREFEIAKEKEQNEIKEKQKEISSKNLVKQQTAFKLIDDADNLLQNENFDNTIENYRKAINILKEIGWTTEYLKLLNETIQNVQERKREREKEKLLQQELLLKKRVNEEEFQKEISKYMEREKKRLKEKEVEIKKREDSVEILEDKKRESFQILGIAEDLLNKGQYEESIGKYHEAEVILNEIGYSTGTIREMIQKVQQKRREDEFAKQKEFELKLRKEYEDRLFQKRILEKLNFEEEKMKIKQQRLKEQEKLDTIFEQKRIMAFNLLEKAQNYIEEGAFDKAVELYKESSSIFIEINWNDQVNLIDNAINEIENKRRELELDKQKQLQIMLDREKEEKEFHEKINKMKEAQQEQLKSKEVALKERDVELLEREKKKENAFKLLDKAQNFLTQGKFNDAIEVYNNVINLFAQIQWNDEITLITKTIQEIEDKKREKELIKQKEIQMEVEKEKEDFNFLGKIRKEREREKFKALQQQELIEKQRVLSYQNLERQNNAFNFIEQADQLLKQKEFDKCIELYEKAIQILSEIGWTSEYLKLLNETIQTIKTRKLELEKERALKEQLILKQKMEEEKFQSKIIEYMNNQKAKIKNKRIEIQKQEKLKQHFEQRRKDAFEIIDQGESLLNEGQYAQSIGKYREAELILNEIGFPTTIINEMIQKIKEKLHQAELQKQKEFEKKLEKERKEAEFRQKIAKQLKIEERKTETKEIELSKQREMYNYMEKRKEGAFNLLDQAETYMKSAQYNKALEYYNNAEIILNEINFPTDSIREMINKVHEKNREFELQKQKDLEFALQRQREEIEIQRQIAKNLLKEKERLRVKEIQILKMEERKARLEKRKEEAFKILDKAEEAVKKFDHDSAIEIYRKAATALNELQFPTDSIENMINNVKELKKEKIVMEESKYRRELERLEEEKHLKALIEERQRQERERKLASQLALQERERIIEKQMNQREAAYSILEKAQTYLKGTNLDYDSAIALYTQARDFLSENIGWQPEINNLNQLIKDLQKEKINYIEKKKQEEQVQIQRQKEYEIFQDEVKERRIEQERMKQEQLRQYRELYLKKEQADAIRDEGLKFIDEGKKWAAYHDFERAYENFDFAIKRFKEIGWEEEVKYIQNEIKNTEILEERAKHEEERIAKIYEQLEQQRILEEHKLKKEDKKLQYTVGEVEQLADEVISLIEERRQKAKLEDTKRKELLKVEAKEFSKKMGGLIKIKEELNSELAKREEEVQKKKQELEKARDREKVDDIKRMIKEANKKKKK